MESPSQKLQKSKPQVKQDVAFVNLGLTHRIENAGAPMFAGLKMRRALQQVGRQSRTWGASTGSMPHDLKGFCRCHRLWLQQASTKLGFQNGSWLPGCVQVHELEVCLHLTLCRHDASCGCLFFCKCHMGRLGSETEQRRHWPQALQPEIPEISFCWEDHAGVLRYSSFSRTRRRRRAHKLC